MSSNDRLAFALTNVTRALNAQPGVDASIETRPVLVSGNRWIPLARRAPLRPMQRTRVASRPRERRSAHGRTRRTATSRDDGSDCDGPPLGRHHSGAVL